MNIGMDIDGVLTDFEWFQKHYGQKYFKRDISNVEGYSISEKFHCSYKEEYKFYIRDNYYGGIYFCVS